MGLNTITGEVKEENQMRSRTATDTASEKKKLIESTSIVGPKYCAGGDDITQFNVSSAREAQLFMA